MRTIFVLVFTTITLFSFGQSSESTKILDALASKYRDASVDMELDIVIEVPGDDEVNLASRLQMRNAQYRFLLGKREILSDGKDLYTFDPERNEVQINNLKEGDSFFSPNTILNLHKSGDYEHILANTFTYKGKVSHQIEFKPTSDMDDIVKYRIMVDKNENEITEIVVSLRDGVRYTLTFTGTTFNKDYPADKFVFKKDNYPDAYIEDLRID